MRHRTIALFLLACTLLGVPYLRERSAEADCQERFGSGEGSQSLIWDGPANADSSCPTAPPQPVWVRAAGIAGAVALIAFLGSLFVALRQRRHDRNMLRAAGLRVQDEDLPLDV